LPEANEHVQHFAKGDEKAGKEWEDDPSMGISHTSCVANQRPNDVVGQSE
jgi:hypothetical protein